MIVTVSYDCVVGVLTISVDISIETSSLELVTLATAGEVLVTIGTSVTRAESVEPFCCTADGNEITDPIGRHASTTAHSVACKVNTRHLRAGNMAQRGVQQRFEVEAHFLIVVWQCAIRTQETQ